MDTDRRALFILAAIESGDRKALELSQFKSAIHNLENMGVSVSVRFASNFKGVDDILKSFDQQSIELLVLGAHGDSLSMDFGEEVFFRKEFRKTSFELLQEDGLIVLSSCSTGKIDRYGTCIANTLSCVSRREVLAPSMTIIGLNIVQKNELKRGYEINFNSGDYLISSRLFNCMLQTKKYNDLLSIKARVKEEKDAELLFAARNNRLKRVLFLIKTGADLNKTTFEGISPLSVAAQRGHLKVVEALIKAGADLNKATSEGFCPLSLAVQEGHLEIVEALIKAGADLNKATEGYTALSLAVQEGHLEIVEALIKAGADLNKATTAGWTPLFIVIVAFKGHQEHLDIVEALIKAGADLNKASTAGWTPLHLAVKLGHLNIAKVLFQAGAHRYKATTANADKITPYASRDSDELCTDVLAEQ